MFLPIPEGGLASRALKRLSNEVVELSRVYVRPAYSGRGIAKAILGVILARARRSNKNVCLETAIFMTGAHALYRSLGFQETEPFRQVPDRLKDP